MLNDSVSGIEHVGEENTVVTNPEPKPEIGGGGSQSQSATGNAGDAPEVLQSPGAQSGNDAGLGSPVASSDQNPIIDPITGNMSTPVVQPQIEFDSLLAGTSTSSGESSEEHEEKLRSLSDIYQNSSVVELMYDSDGEALLVEMEEPTNYKEAAGYAEWTKLWIKKSSQ